MKFLNLTSVIPGTLHGENSIPKKKEKKCSSRRKIETLKIINNRLVPANESFASMANVSLAADWPESSCLLK